MFDRIIQKNKKVDVFGIWLMNLEHVSEQGFMSWNIFTAFA